MTENLLESALGHDAVERLQGLVRQMQSDNHRRNLRETEVSDHVACLEDDIGLLALLQIATLRLLDQKGVLTHGELAPALDWVDLLDGVKNGALSLETIREAMGVPRRSQAETEELQIPDSTAKQRTREPASKGPAMMPLPHRPGRESSDTRKFQRGAAKKPGPAGAPEAKAKGKAKGPKKVRAKGA